MKKEKNMKNKIISIIAKLDNGSHSSNQLRGVDELLTDLFSDEISKIVKQFSYLATDKWHRNAYEKIGNDILKRRI